MINLYFLSENSCTHRNPYHLIVYFFSRRHFFEWRTSFFAGHIYATHLVCRTPLFQDTFFAGHPFFRTPFCRTHLCNSSSLQDTPFAGHLFCRTHFLLLLFLQDIFLQDTFLQDTFFCRTTLFQDTFFAGHVFCNSSFFRTLFSCKRLPFACSPWQWGTAWSNRWIPRP